MRKGQYVKEGLIFSNTIEDACVNTYLKLDDYSWMNYVLKTRFRTEEQGVLKVKFEYSGFNISHMKAEQFVDGGIL